MRKLWARATERIDALTLRERVIIFVVLATLLVTVTYAAVIDAEFARSARLQREIAQRQAEARSFQDQIAKLLQARQQDPDRDFRARLVRLRAQLADIEAKIASEERKFTGPAKMRTVIEELLARNKRVRLVDLHTLPRGTIADARAGGPPQTGSAKPAAERLIYRHGIELTIAGSYLDLLAYVSDLERLPTQLYWGTLDLDAGQYPTVTMKLTVYTLSLDRAWMSV